MEGFAKYILNEKDLISKMEILYFLAPKIGIKFDKSMVFKTEIARMFLKYTKADVDENIVLTACLLCNCKKVDDAQKMGKVQTYAKEGALYLKELGFDEGFCKICEGVNRYSGLSPRPKESDILELIDQFGGMLMDRPERVGMQPDEALVLLEHRNLRDEYNKYLEVFKNFVNAMEKVEVCGVVKSTAFARLQKLNREAKGVPELVRNISIGFLDQIEEKIEHMHFEKVNKNRAMFSSEIEEKILGEFNQE